MAADNSTRVSLTGEGAKTTKILCNDLSPTELEIEATKLLKLGFGRRGYKVKHNGKMKTKAPGGKPDIEVYDDRYHINVEVTKTTKSQADREFNSIKAHLQHSSKENKNKKCLCIYVSPETFKRNMDSFSMFNRESNEMIFPLNFETFNIFIKYIIENDNKYFGANDVEKFFALDLRTSTTDCDVLEFINKTIIKDPNIVRELVVKRKTQQQEKNREIEAIMRKIHNMLRRKHAKNPDEAVKEVSKIIFVKMYEEGKELENASYENRATIKKLEQFKRDGERDPLNYLFAKIKDEMKTREPESLIFDDNETVDLDNKTVKEVLKLINGYSFVRFGIDIKGRIYELFLGSTMKNTALGQYFTPDEIIEFITEIADLKIKNTVLDPACGTGRFLTRAMNLMIDKAEKNAEFTKRDIVHIKKHQVYGIDLSKAVFKIARMNMYIHGDGKSNVLKQNFITSALKTNDGFDVILTNPPFGDINLKEDVEDFDKHERRLIKQLSAIETQDENGNKKIRSKGYKGSSLLLQKANVFLRNGGKFISVVDEGILNTEDYAKFRKFIRDNYFIRGVFSLPQTTFKRLAKSSPKSSIIYLIKKENLLDSQKTPIFFAQLSKVGIDTRGKPCRNDFDIMKKPFLDFLREVEKNKEDHSGIFNRKTFRFTREWKHHDDSDLFYYYLYPEELEGRLDVTYNRPDLNREIKNIKKADFHVLKNLTKSGTEKGLTPSNAKDKKKEVKLLTIKNIESSGRINYKDVAYISRNYFESRKAQMGLEKGDVLVAITGATIGKVAIFNDDEEIGICGDIAKIRPKNKKDSLLIASFLNSTIGQKQIKKYINGSTNFHLSIRDVDKIVIPKLKSQKQLNNTINDFNKAIEKLWKLEDVKKRVEKWKKDIYSEIISGNREIEQYESKVKEIIEFLEKMEKQNDRQ